MEENMNTTEQTTQAENMGNETEVQGTAQEGSGKESKLFTQDEVNSFVQSRIARIKGQINKEAQAEYEQKVAELKAREMKLMVKEKLSDRGMPKDLADIITCTDEEDLKNKLDKLNDIYGIETKKEKPTGFVQIGTGGHPNIMGGTDPVRRAMGLDRKE